MDQRTLFVDVDETLLLHDRSKYPGLPLVTITCNGRTFEGRAHQKNINLLVKFYKLSYEIILWSRTGKSWAEAVAVELGLSGYASAYLTKPDFYLDDKPVDQWIGPRVYRNAVTGDSEV